MLTTIEEARTQLSKLRTTESIGELKIAVVLVERSFRDLHDEYVELNSTIRWQRMYRAIDLAKKQKKLGKINDEYINEIYSSCTSLLNDLQKEITPKSKRVQHFLGAIAFAFFIPVLKFLLSYINKEQLGASEAIQNSLQRFDILLALVMYQWVVTYNTKNQIRKTLVISFAIITTIVLLISSFHKIEFFTEQVSTLIIFGLSVVVFIVHLVEAWVKYVVKCHKFAYF